MPLVFLTRECDFRWCWYPPRGSYYPESRLQTILIIDSQAATDLAKQDALVEIFERIEGFFRRLETYTTVPTTDAMKDIIVKIMAEVLGIFAIVTKEIKLGLASESTPR